VLVLGIGNSACDIAVESSRVATSTDLAMRRGAHIVPKYLLGVPTDRLTDSPLARGPFKLQQWSMAALLRLTQGKVTDYGLPEPDHAVLHAHPTVSQDLLNRLGHGDITVRPNIDRFEGEKVFFTDGSSGEYDVVVYCTGYKVSFPFLDDTVVRAEDNHIDLYRRVVDPAHAGLYFIGLIQPLGAIMPLAEAQAEWVADLVTGVGRLPSVDQMRQEIAAYDAGLRKRYVASKRHTIEVDFHAYRAEIGRERKRSRKRAQETQR
jgi:cation diffusion facilitator CzcD-associated flavoprotein CzcO